MGSSIDVGHTDGSQEAFGNAIKKQWQLIAIETGCLNSSGRSFVFYITVGDWLGNILSRRVNTC